MAPVMISHCFLLFLFLSSSISLIVNSQQQQHHHHHHHHVCDPKQSLALLQFKNAFFQPTPSSSCGQYLHGTFYESTPHYRLSKWNESTDCCSWDGVECDDDGQGHVVGLHLGCSLLHGTLHPNSTLFTLSHLKTLNLSFNHFSQSPISPKFGIMLTNLRVLDLSCSSFQGQVPMQISYLSNLVSLNLSSNFDLTFSNVVMNQLVHNLTNLRDLQLSHTDLSSITPTSFINFSLSLQSLDLTLSSLSGNFPNHIFSFPNLNVLNLQLNPELDGHLPMANWSKSLQTLVLSFTNFSGEIPNSISEAKVLSYLGLSFCNFNGEVPDFETHSNPLIMGDQLVPNCVFNNFTQQTRSSSSFTNLCSVHTPLPNLISVNLRGNSFTGSIPSWIFSSPNLKILNLDDNNFSGFMRDFSSNSLEYLNLSNNNLQGEISESIYRQLNLVYLALQSNNMSGVLNLDRLRIPSLRSLQISNNSRLSIFSTNVSSSNLTNIGMASLNNLGKIPYFLRDQKNLENLYLSNNQMVGKIPEWFFELGNLKFLDLSYNGLSGELPSSCLSNMNNLDTLMLKSNRFSGVIPIPPPNIKYYIASENQFDGEIPHSICLAVNLDILNLSNNRMSGGTIPSCLTNISLSVLDLKGNNFIGTIPTLFSTGCQLRSLDLNDNQIEGELPQSLLNCKNLQILDLGNNNITGYFPYWLKGVLDLRVLILRSNQFYGHINNSFNKDSFSNLRIIDLSHNDFSGPLPSNLFNNMRAIQELENMSSHSFLVNRGLDQYYEDSIVISLKGLERSLGINLFIWKTIDLSSNDFNGEIPKEIGTLRSLLGLNLSHNKLRGGIPTSLGSLSNLEWLDLSSNQLFGSIPPQLVSLTFLSCLNLSQNELSGPIPKGTQFGTFENSSYFGNIGLCGNPLPKCDADQNEHKSQLLQKEEEDDSYEKGIWVKAVFIGYGCGMVFGMFIGYVRF